jgi:hypothetical protein
MDKIEEWRDIPEHEGYQASNLGRVRSNRRHKTWKILSPTVLSCGYERLFLYDGTGNENSRQKYVHRLVLKAFVGDSDLQCDHINGNKSDNRIENLRYCTHAENKRYSKKCKNKKSSIYKGVGREHGRWRSRIMVNRRSISLGLFDTEKDAAIAYNNSAREHHGEFAYLNKIPQ